MKFKPIHKYLSSISFLFFLLQFNQNIFCEELDSLKIKDDESVKIDSILISGNEKTQDFIILRELTFKVGDTVSGKLLRFNRERVFSLKLFNRVEFIIRDTLDHNVLEIHLYESWYLYPLPFVRAENGNLNRATYGINFMYRNFRGRNETLRALVGFGFDPRYAISYDYPALFFEEGIGISLSVSYANVTNRSISAKDIAGYDYENKIFSQSISLSKRINQFNMAFITAGFNYLETPFTLEGVTASGSRIDRLVLAGISYIYDSRDLKLYSENGLFLSSQYYHKGFGINGISYNDFDFDFREYRNLFEQLSGKWRIVYRRAFGNLVPFYDYSYLGYGERVRGHYNDIREGKGYLLTSFELSYPVVKDWNFHVKLPLLPESLTSARIGIYLNGFIDAGDTFNDSYSFSINHFYCGYGFGITFLFLPYNAFRIEYAVNELGKGEIIFGTGFSF